ncbi:MAG: hypothetical protein HY896_07635 [Deltaproteobacteria bacterium]|nr:hypothetical protein [Deltaproteobacteria bacterium]
MRVPKPFAIFGFHFCTTIFIGLSLYGVVRYMNEGLAVSDSFPASAAYASVVFVSVAGICFFGREADRRKREEVAATPAAPPKHAPKKKKKR